MTRDAPRFRLREPTNLALVMTIAMLATSAQAAGGRFRAAEDPRDEVIFLSKAPMEEFEGAAGRVRGDVRIETLDDLIGGRVEGVVEVDTESLDTGLGLRDRHMREKYLETERFPVARFELREVTAARVLSTESNGDVVEQAVAGLASGVETHLTVKGTFEIHGVRQEIEVEDVVVTLDPELPGADVRGGEMLRIQAAFTVRLADYDVARPKLMFMRLAEDVLIRIDVVLGSDVETTDLLASETTEEGDSHDD